MLLGLLSDTHCNLPAMGAAVDLLQGRGVDHYLHCGDVGCVEVLDYLAGLPAAFVWGNCDWDRAELQRHAAALSIICHGPFAELTFDGKLIALMHGDDARQRSVILDQQRYDYLIQGHTHVRADGRIGRTRIVNPGALHRARDKTVAILDTAADTVEFIAITLP